MLYCHGFGLATQHLSHCIATVLVDWNQCLASVEAGIKAVNLCFQVLCSMFSLPPFRGPEPVLSPVWLIFHGFGQATQHLLGFRVAGQLLLFRAWAFSVPAVSDQDFRGSKVRDVQYAASTSRVLGLPHSNFQGSGFASQCLLSGVWVFFRDVQGFFTGFRAYLQGSRLLGHDCKKKPKAHPRDANHDRFG